ncbi:breast cancer protein [Poronia punctata]|nr:breast cancer protein [Poronia punctata]
MSRFSSWFRGSGSKASSIKTSGADGAPQVNLHDQAIELLRDAMMGADLIMNDDIDGAEERLKQGDSTYHSFGLAVCVFMRSILGFEKDVMADAGRRLAEVETAAWAEIKKAEKEASISGRPTERIHPPGSEYQLVLAESYLMSALIGVLHESLTEALKSFYKLRKAYTALETILQAEKAYFKKHGLQTDPEPETARPSGKMPGSFDDDTDLEFQDADESLAGQPTPLEYEGHLENGGINEAEKTLKNLSLKDGEKSGSSPSGSESDPKEEVFSDPIDAFVHSGATMCFGVLLLIISLVPPAFSRLLSIIGFRGDLERGIEMLWQSSHYENINGAVAGLMLLAYYNGLLGFADIVPSEADVERGAIVGYPAERLAGLLVKLRGRYPDSGLWRFEEARSRGNRRDLTGALEILKNNESKMKQVAALNSFELSLDATYVHDFARARDEYLRCIELNNWSPSLYYYFAGCSQLEIYRDAYFASPKDQSKISAAKKRAEELLRKAPSVAGKKRFMARPLPFEEFVVRKMQKWEERSKSLGADLADVIGISPIQEMIYLWNGLKKMSAEELGQATEYLSWDRLTCSQEIQAKLGDETEEQALYDLCYAAISRNLGDFDKARTKLDEIISLDRSAFKGTTKDDYIPPAAHYEMAVLIWAEGQGQMASSPTETKKCVEDCQSWLDKVAKWDSYILDGRVSMRVQAGLDTLRWYKSEHGMAS